jgi:tetratricopeptide (TPR) repeat protein
MVQRHSLKNLISHYFIYIIVKYNELLKSFQQEYNAKNYKGALKFIREATKKEPNHVEAWLMLSNLYLLNFNAPEMAMNSLKYAFRSHPNNPNLLFVQAECYMRLQKYNDSYDILLKILDINRENTQTWDLLDKIYIADPKFRPRIDQLCIDHTKRNLSDAQMYSRQNQISDAIRCYEHVIQTHPSNIQVVNELAQLYFQIGNYAASLSYVQQLLINQPQNARAMALAANNYWKLNDLTQAHDMFRKSLQFNSNQPETKKEFQKLSEQLANDKIKSGDKYYREGKFEDAVRAFQTALKYLPADPQILQKIKQTQTTQESQEQQQKDSEDQDFLTYLREEAEISEDLDFQDILEDMPPHSDVKDVDSLRGLLKRLIVAKMINAVLTLSSLKFTGTISPIVGQNPSINPRSYQPSSHTIALRNPNILVIVLRDGALKGSSYHYRVKVQNNSQDSIFQIVVFTYFPQSFLKLESSNPQFIPTLQPGQQAETNFVFNAASGIIEGKIQSLVIYLDTQGDLRVIEVSALEIENVTATMQPIPLDPSAFATVLHASQKYDREQESFVIAQTPPEAFQSIQQNLQQMHFHIQKAVQSEPNQGTTFNGMIYATARPSNSADPVLLDIRVESEGSNSTKISVKSSATSKQMSQILTRSVKSYIMMPKCETCGNLFPISQFEKIKRGIPIICEICGSPARFH